jgi:hypothetical protein
MRIGMGVGVQHALSRAQLPQSLQVCFVGDEAFRELSQPDDNAHTLLTQAMAKDHSREWHGNRAKAVAAAAAKTAASPAAAPAAAAGAAPGGK